MSTPEIPALSAEAKAALPEIIAFLAAKRPTFRYKTAMTAIDIVTSVLDREINPTKYGEELPS